MGRMASVGEENVQGIHERQILTAALVGAAFLACMELFGMFDSSIGRGLHR
jgi:hypothetical protein